MLLAPAAGGVARIGGTEMARDDAEVEQVLLEIRQRLQAEVAGRDEEIDRAGEALARIEASLAVAARAWDRLPPVLSDRRGWRGRLEIWIKRRVSRAMNWFTWEQVNFNAAVADALSAAQDALVAQREREAETRERVDSLAADLEELRLRGAATGPARTEGGGGGAREPR